MYEADVKINKKKWVDCNLYYLRKFIGFKEILLVVLLIISGLVLGIGAQNYFILVISGITILILFVALIIYYSTTLSGFKNEFQSREASKWLFSFSEVGVTIYLFEKGVETQYSEKRFYEELDRIALLKDKVYLYFGAALMYYIDYSDFTKGNFVEFCEFLKERVEPKKFKMKAKFRRYREIK
ncbi:MAG: hypothetical protein LBU04_07050 [Christensenellaceae bacterium]|jgi:hypothetical protein|nr:hypothetical protein [Christensenellaceae bacterium]